MGKMKIELRRPQYVVTRDPMAREEPEASGEKMPLFFRFLMVVSYVLSALAFWFVYQRFSIRF
ncbi:MAG TPA: hypothetical protein PLL75_03425 [Candidatus Omnitrophota bacterium]|nr:hypothetical protein [Candidatus Omnitrophota bacterium]HPS36764.1 hypothetical protein [Candidatus Omnitrophota bacterium]